MKCSPRPTPSKPGTGGTWGGITGGTAGFTALGADIRSQKSIQYRIATPSGFGGSLMYGAKNSGYLGRYNKFMGGAVTYKTSIFDIGIGHNQGEDLAGRKSLTTTTVGGSVKVGDFKFFAGYHNQVNRNSALLADYLNVFTGSVAPGLRAAGVPAPNIAALNKIYNDNITRNSQVDACSYQVGLHYRLGQGRLMASAARQNDRTASNSDATLMAVGYDYNISARTVYLQRAVVYQEPERWPVHPGRGRFAGRLHQSRGRKQPRGPDRRASPLLSTAPLRKKDACGRLFSWARASGRLELRDVFHPHQDFKQRFQ